MIDVSLPRGQIQDKEIVVEGPLAISLYNKGYYGRPEANKVVLAGFEALHLLELGRLEIYLEDQQVNEAQIMQYLSNQNPTFMPRYLVYKDLRNRGYIVNIGAGSSFFFRLYDRGAIPKKDAARYYVTPLQEGNSIQLGALEKLVKIAEDARKALIFGLVDAVGDVSYLKISQLSPPNLLQKHKVSESWSWETAWDNYLSWD